MRTYFSGISYNHRNIERLRVYRIFRVERALAAHRLPVVGCEDDNRIFIESECLQFIEYSSELAVNCRDIRKIVARGRSLHKSSIRIRTKIQLFIRHILIYFVILRHTVFRSRIWGMWRIVSHNKEERSVGFALAIAVAQILYCLVSLVFYGKLLWRVLHTVCIPIMRVFVNIECPVGIPPVKAMAPLRRSVGIPLGATLTHIMSRIFRVVLCREIRVEFAYVTATVALGFKHIAYADSVFAKTALRPFCHTVERNPASFRVHPREENSSVRTAQGTVAHRIGKHY